MAKVLVVEDIAYTRDGMCDILCSLGHYVDAATDGADADVFLKLFKYDLVVTDIMMPHKNGFELVKDIRKNTPSTKILVISGGGNFYNQDICDAISDVASDKSIQKPFSKREFISSVNDLIAESD